MSSDCDRPPDATGPDHDQDRKLRSLLQLGQLIGLDLQLDEMLLQIARKATEVMEADRFSIFLHELGFVKDSSSVRSNVPLWLGTALVTAGVLMNVISAWHHARLVGTLNRGETPPSRPSAQAVILALLLALIGLGMTIYLISLQYRHGSM